MNGVSLVVAVKRKTFPVSFRFASLALYFTIQKLLMLLERIWDAVRRVGWTVFVKIVNGFYLLPIFVKKAPLKTLKITISKFVSSNKSMILDNLVEKSK